MHKKQTKILVSLLFHFYKNHKNLMTDLRIWIISRNIADNGSGKVLIADVAKIAKIKAEYLKAISKNSPLFHGYWLGNLYYVSAHKICKNHSITKKIRRELLNASFINQFKSKKMFEGFITKCYVEQDIDKKNKGLTKGKISYQMAADGLGISRLTAITNLKKSTAKKIPNTIEYPNITFANKKEFGNWLLKNMSTKIGQYIISKNPKSYKIKFNGSNYHLVQELPNRYRLTGFSWRA